MKVFVFDRNGEEWADVAAPIGVKVRRTIECNDKADALAKAKKERGRVAAVLERVASDMPTLEAPKQVSSGSFWRRLKWLATGN